MDIYHWIERWNPIWIVILLAVAFFYLRKKGTSPRQKTVSLVALALIYGSVGTPFQIFADHGLFTAYMLQQSVLYLVVPPLLIAAIPKGWLIPLMWRPRLKKMLEVMTYPWLTAILFNVGFSVYLLPFVFNAVHTHPMIMNLCHLFLFLTAGLMWWSVLSPLRELNPLSELGRIFYIFITAIMLTPIAMLLLFSGDVMYPAYAAGSDMFKFLTPKYDQQMGAGVLKAFQLTVYGIELGIIVFRWIKSEQDKENERKGKVIPFKKVH